MIGKDRKGKTLALRTVARRARSRIFRMAVRPRHMVQRCQQTLEGTQEKCLSIMKSMRTIKIRATRTKATRTKTVMFVGNQTSNDFGRQIKPKMSHVTVILRLSFRTAGQSPVSRLSHSLAVPIAIPPATMAVHSDILSMEH